MSGVILLKLDEPTAVQPSDKLGNLDDLATEVASFVAAGTAVTARSTTITLATPAGVLPGDTLLMFAFSATTTQSDLTTGSLPAGWSLLSRVDTLPNGRLSALARRTVVAGEPATHVFPMTSTGVGAPLLGVIVAYRGLDPAAALVSGGVAEATATTSFPCPSLTLASASDLYLGWAPSNNNTASSTPPAGATERVDQGAAQSGFNRAVVFELRRGVAGATGTQTATASLTVSGVAAAYVLRARSSPLRVGAWTGFGRQFSQSGSGALVAADKSSNGTLLQRDVTIQGLLSVTLTGATGPMTVIARGLNDGTASERYAYGLELEQQAGFPGFVEVRWFWQDSAGTVRTQPAGVFKHPGDGVIFMLTATRRWVSSTRVVLRYYVADQLIAELESSNGDISGGTTGRTTVGARKAAGAFERYYNGVLDELAVYDNELSLPEIRHTWLRLTEYQPGGVETFAALAPPGSSWARPETDIGKRVKIVGQLLGGAAARADEVRALILPDAAPLGIVERWERITEQSAAPGDSLDVRHARLGSYFAREEGLSLPPLKEALSGPLALAVEDIQIDEFEHTVTDDFTSSISSAWLNGGDATWSIASGKLQGFAPAGSDLRWETRKVPALLHPCHPGRLFVSARVESADYSTGVTNQAFVGLALHNRHSGDWLWFGVFNNGGDPEIVFRTSVGGAAPSPFQNFTGTGLLVGTGPYILRIATDQSPGYSITDDEITLSLCEPAQGPEFFTQTINTGVTGGWHWAGFALASSLASTGGNTTIQFDDFVMHAADSDRPFYWYAFRDPLLAGTPDLVGGERLVQKIKPAYTIAHVITERACPCDDPVDGVCDHGPTA